MIETPTVLILGAGASIPYGFPSGKELVGKVVGGLNSTTTEFFQALRACNIAPNPQDLSKFSEALLFSQRLSVDAFLEYRTDFLEIGRYAIAAALIPFETEHSLFSNGDWYRHLLEALNTSFKDFGENRLSIITFNYDRSLEFYLLTALRNAYNKTGDEAANVLGKIPIIHLHGQLAPLDQQGVNGKGRAYGIQTDPESLRRAASGIKIIHEATDKDPEFMTARCLIQEAEKICFLGFGYHPDNVRRLFGDSDAPPKAKVIIGGAYGLTDAEKRRIRRGPLAGMSLREKGWGNLDVLRESGILFES